MNFDYRNARFFMDHEMVPGDAHLLGTKVYQLSTQTCYLLSADVYQL